MPLSISPSHSVGTKRPCYTRPTWRQWKPLSASNSSMCSTFQKDRSVSINTNPPHLISLYRSLSLLICLFPLLSQSNQTAAFCLFKSMLYLTMEVLLRFRRRYLIKSCFQGFLFSPSLYPTLYGDIAAAGWRVTEEHPQRDNSCMLHIISSPHTLHTQCDVIRERLLVHLRVCACACMYVHSIEESSFLLHNCIAIMMSYQWVTERVACIVTAPWERVLMGSKAR